jgi:hypothetical protein
MERSGPLAGRLAPANIRPRLTEPSADRGPRRGSPAGVVEAPDASVNRRGKRSAKR